MKALSYQKFIKTLPDVLVPTLPPALQGIKVRQPFRWIIQFHYGETRLHYEVSRVARTKDLELGMHFEARDKTLNRYLLQGFRRHLFEIRDTLGETIEAEMWDRGWTKVYEVYPAGPLTAAYQSAVARRLTEIMACFHPIYIDLRRDVARVYR